MTTLFSIYLSKLDLVLALKLSQYLETYMHTSTVFVYKCGPQMCEHAIRYFVGCCISHHSYMNVHSVMLTLQVLSKYHFPTMFGDYLVLISHYIVNTVLVNILIKY